MHNWPGGTRETRTKSDGLKEQLITLRNAEEVKLWSMILGDLAAEKIKPPNVSWQNDLTFAINDYPLVCQSQEQRDQWYLTFPLHIRAPIPGDKIQYQFTPGSQTHEPYAVFYPRGTGGLLVLGCKAKQGAAASASAAPPVNFDAMQPKELRTYAAQKGLKINMKEPKALLVERLKQHLAGAA